MSKMLTYQSLINLNIIFVCFFKFFFIKNVLSTEQAFPVHMDNRKQISIEEDRDWSLKDLHNLEFNQVPGIAFNKSTLSIFHRANVIWDEKSFDENEIYKHQNQPIIVDPVLNFNLSGEFVSSFGKNHFFMPHGITLDPFGHMWLTDVALHQVFRFNKDNLTTPELVLGEKFVPNSDIKHFCKPTDVQVATKTKQVFISDGYCNSRVMVFNYDGKFIKQFGQDQRMVVSHSLSLIEELDLICVADRENGRAFCYNAGIKDQSKLGELKKELKTDFDFKLYAIQNIGTYLFGVLVKQYPLPTTKGIIFDLKKDSNNELVWQNVLALSIPHDITLDNENNIYISDIDSKLLKTRLVKKFLINNLNLNKSNSYLELENRPKLKRVDDHKSKEEEDLKSLAFTTTQMALKELDSKPFTNLNDDKKSKGSLLLFIIFIFFLLLISAVLFVLKKRTGIENYIRNLGGLSSKVVYSKDLYINDPERAGFNILREEEENLFDFELENNSSESEIEEFNFKHARKI